MPDSQAGQPPQEPVELQLDTAVPDGDGGGPTAARTATLVRLIRVAYPHPSFPDGPYERTARAVRDADSADLIPAGLDELDAAAGGDFASLDDDAATAAVEKIADGPFFKLVHSTTVVALYDDHEVWELLGYEGAAFDKGGYLDRGFDDLNWLPDARVEEYTGEPRIELVPTEQGAHR
ncbi:MAG: hypothetical protein ABJA16_11280 [Nakamurella sp.]